MRVIYKKILSKKMNLISLRTIKKVHSFEALPAVSIGKGRRRINCVATIGVFDGVHLGHKFILEKLRKKSRQLDLPSLVVTFDVPPQILLQKKNRRVKEFPGFLADIEDKATFLKEEGIDYVWFLKANTSLLRLSGRKFLDYLFKYFIIKHFIIGEDFRFGHNGKANIRYLEKISKRYGFKVTVLTKIAKTKHTISSSLLRRLIKKSRFEKVENFLGRKFYIKGKVIKGRGYGRKLGFPTANIDYDGYVIPRDGVYAAYVEIGKKQYLSAANIGIKPTISESHEKILEAHILNLRKNILGKEIKIRFIKRLRDEKKFFSENELKQAIAKDINYIKEHYKT